MIDWFNINRIEIIGALFAFLYLLLEIKRKWPMWIVGIISSIFYVYIFFEAKLYAEMGLNAYYVLMSFYGLYCWKFMPEQKETNDFHFISTKLSYWLIAISILILAAMAFILIRFTDSPVPIPDALVATLSIIATWMTAKKIVECWYLWIFVNFFAIGLYLYQELYPTAILFAAYGILSIVGLIEWRKAVIKKK